MTVTTEKPSRFPIYIRIPGWGSAKVTAKGRTSVWTAGSTAKLDEKWLNGDQIMIEIPMAVRFEKRYNNALSVLRGPLYFSLRIDKEYKNTKINYNNFGYMGSVDWVILPKSDWNYSLLVDINDPEKSFTVTESKPGKYPFADSGDMVWSEMQSKYVSWTGDAPVVLRTRGILTPEWKLKDNSADIPQGELPTSGPPSEITLVPYGCARLRITEFPVANATFMKKGH
jgi:hypothetical protein